MSDKLQEIKNALKENGELIGVSGYAFEYISWLIEQLEQAHAEKEVIVKELGELTLLLESETYWATLLEQVNELKAANQKLMTTLEWYGDENSHKINVTNQWEPVIPLSDDRGQRARQTLSEVKGNG